MWLMQLQLQPRCEWKDLPIRNYCSEQQLKTITTISKYPYFINRHVQIPQKSQTLYFVEIWN